MGTYNYRENKRTNLDENLYKNNEQEPYEQYSRSLDGNEIEQNVGLIGFYEHVFNREEEYLFRADVEYQQETETENDQWINDTTATNHFKSNQTVYALFGTLTCSWKKFTVMAGLRAEETTVNTPVLVQESTRRRDARVIYSGFVFNIGTNGKKTTDPKFEYDTGMDR